MKSFLFDFRSILFRCNCKPTHILYIPSKCPVEVLISLYGWKLNLFGNWTWRNEKWIWQLGWFCQLTATLDDPEYHQIVIQYFSHGWNLKCWYFVSILEAKYKHHTNSYQQRCKKTYHHSDFLFCSGICMEEGNSFFSLNDFYMNWPQHIYQI